MVFSQFITHIFESGAFPADAHNGLAGGQFFDARAKAGFQTVLRLSLVDGQKPFVSNCLAVSQPFGLVPGLLDRRFGMSERLGRTPLGPERLVVHISVFSPSCRIEVN